ncbi:hypothetical protein Q4503_10125 [Colwellia sp. 6_MG-2023]|jgi:hypothetical protein|uniref:hypothetical protein n=1 Tax=Colwellia sp. 6_MG-2023 TaxID=3062676 RepID=UPI0026E46CF0|nr:hypothetical protein [Colwellia sp. 6_MG-2023]MDO6488057.1 hypothetical protein [Colwellia sp. 6_MG-2023]
MRNLILTLNKLLGAQHNKEINRWVSGQYGRTSLYNNEMITLNDVCENEIILTVSDALSKLSLTPHHLFRYCMLLPSINKGLQKFTVVFEIKPGFYKQLLTSTKKIRIDDMSIVNKGDLFERYGQLKHIKHEANQDVNDPVYYFINGIVIDSEQPFSLGFNQTELQAVGESIFEKKYNNANPLNKDEWHDMIFSALFLRMLDDDPSLLIYDVLNEDKIDKLLAAKSWDKTYYNNAEEDTDTIYSSYGRVIAKKSNRFNAITARQNTETNTPTLSLVSSTDLPKKLAPEKVDNVPQKKLTSNDAGFVYDEFGEF